ncbi:Hypothetical predicted protein [Lynx pardinus]|uniref:Uncharacterized protein n=1 Tax=Lynx pardinus TaxID=191816 RepID=A0A485PF56_LYNPA|nr:Hypothetical predicted protein [Lynx pardinus]
MPNGGVHAFLCHSCQRYGENQEQQRAVTQHTLAHPLSKVAKHQHKENHRQMDWIVIFASHHSGMLQPVFDASPPQD